MEPKVEITKRCSECGRDLIVRTNTHNGSEFLGCAGYPDFCTHTERIPESLKLRREGHPTFPGME